MSKPELEMSPTKTKFLNVISYLARSNSAFDHNDIERFYEYSYDLARLNRLNPSSFQLSVNEKEKFVNSFPTALKNAANNTTALYHTLSPDSLNHMRKYRSKMEFIKEDIFDLYKEANDNQVSKDLEETIKKIQGEGNNIDDYLESWTGPHGEGNDDPNDVPNLNGVPESHNWWTDKHRNLWKNKNE